MWPVNFLRLRSSMDNRIWVRVDNRLIHGQVIETWVPYSKVDTLVVVNDELAVNGMRQDIMRMAVPCGIQLFFSTIGQLAGNLTEYVHQGSRAFFLLFANCQDARLAYEKGISFRMLNIGNLHYAPGKHQICDHIALSKEDIACLGFFSRKGVELDFRCIPSKKIQVKPIW